jgi:3-phenylpropionate/trans-cinnamate dioxygenase ferredoxin reductase component
MGVINLDRRAAPGYRLYGSIGLVGSELYHYLPFFFSDPFELGYQAVGEPDERLATFADWEEPSRKGVVYYLGEERVRGVLLWNVWNKITRARQLIAEPGPFKLVDKAQLTRFLAI